MRKLIHFFAKHFWWRLWYHKTKITTIEAHQGRCLLCHASIKVNKNSNQPICTERNHPCPCKWNERLISKLL